MIEAGAVDRLNRPGVAMVALVCKSGRVGGFVDELVARNVEGSGNLFWIVVLGFTLLRGIHSNRPATTSNHGVLGDVVYCAL